MWIVLDTKREQDSKLTPLLNVRLSSRICIYSILIIVGQPNHFPSYATAGKRGAPLTTNTIKSYRDAAHKLRSKLKRTVKCSCK